MKQKQKKAKEFSCLAIQINLKMDYSESQKVINSLGFLGFDDLANILQEQAREQLKTQA
ncbi:MAG: hypothetical protein ABH986_03650 [archaeon]